MCNRKVSAQALGILCMLAGLSGVANAQTDPGPRAGSPGAGGPIAGLTVKEGKFFDSGLDAFSEVDGVADGLGPRFNLDSCAGCHAAPTPGGTSPAVNPQIPAALKNGASNRIPPFIQPNGPAL